VPVVLHACPISLLPGQHPTRRQLLAELSYPRLSTIFSGLDDMWGLVSVPSQGALFFTQTKANYIRKLDLASGSTTIVAGTSVVYFVIVLHNIV